MIKFSCKKCGQRLNVEDKHSGKRVKCPKCGSVGVVPDNSDKIKFRCKNCGQSISVPQIHAGKKGKCPKCKNLVVIPALKRETADNTETFSIVCSMCGKTIQVPKKSIGQTIECPACGSYIETLSESGSEETNVSISSGTDENQYDAESDVPEEGEGVDRHLIFFISGVAAVVVVGLVVLVTVILPSGSRQVEKPAVSPQQQVVDTYSQPQPVATETQPKDSFVLRPPREKSLPEESISSEQEVFRGNKIAFASDRDGNYEIYIMNEDGSGIKRLTNNPDEDVFPSWSPDGTKIAFESRRDGNPEIYLMNADGTEQTNLTNNSSWDQFPLWSPDGQKIAFHSLRDKNHEIYTMNTDGSDLKRLTNNITNDMSPSWSPDRKKIAFFAQRDGNPEIYVMNPDGSEQTRLTNNPARDTSPAWSPDAKKITFTSNRDGNYEIYVMMHDGSDQKRLTNNPAIDGNPSWAQDGKKILFVSNRDGNREIYVMNADGSEQIRLTNNPAEDRWPCWLPLLASKAGPATIASDEVGGLDLKLRLKAAQKHCLRLYREYNSSYTFRGQQHDRSDIHITDLKFEVEQVDANGIALLKVTHLRINAIEKTTNGQNEYDSAKPDTIGNSQFGPIFSAMIGQSFMMKVTPEGKIVELEGLTEMYQRMAELVVEYEDEATRQRYAGTETKGSGENAKRQIDRANQKYGSIEERIEATREKLDTGPYSCEENIRDMLGNVIMSFPGRPIGINDSWTTPFSMGNQKLGDCTYTLKETNQTALLVDISLKIKVEEEIPAPADGSRGSSIRTLTGSGQGSLEIDPNTGWMLRKNVTLHYSGETKTPPTAQNPRGTTTPQSMENITTVELIE